MSVGCYLIPAEGAQAAEVPVEGGFRRQEEDGGDGRLLPAVTAGKSPKKHPKNAVFRVAGRNLE